VLPNNCTKLQSDPFSASDYLINANMTGLPDNTRESYPQMEWSGAGEAGRLFSETAINMGNIVLNWDFPFRFLPTTRPAWAFFVIFLGLCT
jgi:hypothetical protein